MTNKKQMIEAQQDKCACCHAYMISPTSIDNQKNTVLCKTCAMIVNGLRSYEEFEKALSYFVEYEKQPPKQY